METFCNITGDTKKHGRRSSRDDTATSLYGRLSLILVRANAGAILMRSLPLITSFWTYSNISVYVHVHVFLHVLLFTLLL